MIININPHFGDSITFEDETEMEQAIMECGYSVPDDGLVEGRDFILYSDWLLLP